MARVIKCPKCEAALDVASVLDVGEGSVKLLAAGEVLCAECYACNAIFFVRPILDWNAGLSHADVVCPVLESVQETQGGDAAAVTVNFDKRSQEVLDQMVGRMSETVNLIGLAQKTLNLNLEAFRKTFSLLAVNERVVPLALAVNLFNAAEDLRDFIKMQPDDSEVIWIGDRKTKVVDTPHYQAACRSISEFEDYIKAKQS